MMRTSQTGIDLIKRFEGLELESYQDIAGIWTIGYGHAGPEAVLGRRITKDAAEQLLAMDLKPREQAVERLVSVPLNQNEFDALVSFVYNVGVEAFSRSTALRRLNAGDRIGAADALTWFNKATVNGVLREVQGLTRRRAAEKALFLTPIADGQTSNNPASDKYDTEEDTRLCPAQNVKQHHSLIGFLMSLIFPRRGQ